MQIEWKVSTSPEDYPSSISFMEKRVDDVIAENASEMIWLLEYPPIFTGGTSAIASDLLHHKFPFYNSGRGGKITYHGPGQRVVYYILKLHDKDLRAHIFRLEQIIIDILAKLGINGERKAGRVGIWVTSNQKEEKIAAIGVRIRKWVAYHGISINLNPDLEHFSYIVPCGISPKEYGVTSLHKIGVNITMDELDKLIIYCSNKITSI